MRLSQRLRGFVGRATPSEEAPAEPVAPPVVPTPAPPPQAPAPPPPAPTPAPAPTAISLSVEAAYAMLQAFPKEAPEQQRLPALRTALSTMAVEKQKTLEQLLAEVLQEKARISLAVQHQEKQFEAQVLKISEAVDALWDKRDKLTEHHQRLTLQAEERMDGLDQLIQCLSQPEEPTVELAPLDDVPEIAPPLVEEGPVLLGGAVLTPIRDLLPDEEERRDDFASSSSSNRRRLYARS